ncbi:MAG: SGNH/GDSL hydrolase family protein [Pseudomonadota bacterium]
MSLAAIRILLGPALLWQGARVRRDILRLPEAAGARDGQIGQGPPLSILLLGDSSIAGVGAASQDEALAGRLTERLRTEYTVTWKVVGMTGWTTRDGHDALAALSDSQFDVVVLSLGVNDVTTETGLNNWLQLYRDLLDHIRQNQRPKLIIVNGFPPMGRFPALPQPLRWYLGQQAVAHERELFKLLADDPGIVTLPLVFDLDVSAMAPDGFHPGPPVYDAWAEDVATLILQSLPKAP